MEYRFTVTVYHLDNARAAELREAIQEVILEEVEMRDCWMGPVIASAVPAEVGNGEEVVA